MRDFVSENERCLRGKKVSMGVKMRKHLRAIYLSHERDYSCDRDNKNLLVRRLNIVANHVIPEADAPKKNAGFEQLDLFTDYAALEVKQEQERAELEREKKMQQAMLTIKKKFGKNAILKGMNLEEGATAKDRNAQIGGHKA